MFVILISALVMLGSLSAVWLLRSRSQVLPLPPPRFRRLDNRSGLCSLGGTKACIWWLACGGMTPRTPIEQKLRFTYLGILFGLLQVSNSQRHAQRALVRAYPNSLR